MKVTRGAGKMEGWLSRQRAERAEYLLPKSLRTGRVLDVGCGVNPFFLTQTNFAERYGLDPEVTATGVEAGLKLDRFDVAKVERLPFDDNFFTAVTMLAVFEHIEPAQLPPLLAEIRRVLAPGGRLVITTPARWSAPVIDVMVHLGLISHEEIDEHQPLVSRAALRRYLETAGFNHEHIDLGLFEFGMNQWAYADK